MSEYTVAQTDIDSLKEHIANNKGKIDATAQTGFCKAWPEAKGALQLLQSVLASIPGISMFANIAITVVIAAGDAAAGALCPPVK